MTIKNNQESIESLQKTILNDDNLLQINNNTQKTTKDNEQQHIISPRWG
jgi:hypothetical protein